MLSSLTSFALYLAFYWLVAEASKNQPVRSAEVFSFLKVKSDDATRLLALAQRLNPVAGVGITASLALLLQKG